MSENCERFEVLISAWVDEELEHREAKEMLDHLVRCGDCRSFYREARALDGVIAAKEETEQPSAALWRQIERAAGPQRSKRIGNWALRAAALAVVAAGLALAVLPRLSEMGPAASGSGDTQEIQVQLGRRSGEMTRDRFFEIATEILEAEDQYRRAMYEVMDDALESSGNTEGGGEAVEAEGESGPRSEGRGRA